MLIPRLQTEDPILFVGEGNFSFSLSIASKLANRLNIVATSFDEESKLCLEHLENAARLRCIQGVEVLFGVDATRLHVQSEVSDRQYARIMFNFPHVGGKSKIQRNRNLLREFFASSCHILQENGEILVTLCRGQGGTAADQNVREWHNSWQVVALAAEANLILREVLPFNVKEFPEYTCIGFRSQDKPFDNEEALVYVFVKGQPLILASQPLLKCLDSGKCCLSYFGEKAIKCNLLESDHPVTLIYDELMARFHAEGQIQTIEPGHLSLLTDVCECVGKSKKQSLCDHVPMFHVRPCDNLACKPDFPIYWEFINRQLTNSPISLESIKDEQLEIVGILRHSMVDNTLQFLTSKQLENSEQLHISAGWIFRNTPISLDSHPIKNEMVGYSVKSVDYLKSLLKNVLSNCLQLYDISFIPTQKKRGQKTTILYIIEAKQQHYEQGACEVHDSCHKKNSDAYCSLEYKKVQFGELFLAFSDGKFMCSGFAIDLTLLSMLKFNIKDWRILFTHKVRKYFCEVQHKVHFISDCLYPPVFVHDVSFWVNDSVIEAEFYCIVRCVCGDIVRDVSLLDEYYEPHTRRLSKCYRLTYQSLQQPLSYKLASDLQLLLRSKLESVLQLEMR